MPRVKLAGDVYKDRDLSELIRRYKYGKGLNNNEAAAMIGVCERTWRNHMENPAQIPLERLRAIQKKLGIPKEEMLKFLL